MVSLLARCPEKPAPGGSGYREVRRQGENCEKNHIYNIDVNRRYRNSLRAAMYDTGITVLPIYFCDGTSKLANATLPQSLTTISNRSFYGTTALKNLVFPAR